MTLKVTDNQYSWLS